MAEAVVAKKPARVKKAGPSFSEHLRRQNVFFYISAFCSLALIVLLFVPWIKADPAAHRESASFIGLMMKCVQNVNLLIFMVPITLIFVGIHVVYLVSILRPGHDPIYLGTVSILLAGLSIFMLVFATDTAYDVVATAQSTDLMGWHGFLTLTGASTWTPVPIVWLVLTLLQKWVFVKFAHPKQVISYPDAQ